MGVKLGRILELPSMRGARVMAGKGALEREVLSLSFLEACDMVQLRKSVLKPDEYFLGEIDVTSLYTVRNDVVKQCELVRGMHELGVVGMIVYYVGIFVPYLDERLLKTADEDNFAIIQMPAGNSDIRFNEAVTDISQMLFENRDSEFERVITHKLSEVPKWSQTVETALKMLADVLCANVVIANRNDEIEYSARWPRNSSLSLSGCLSGAVKPQDGSVFSMPLSCGNDNEYSLWIVRERGQLTERQLQQARDVVETALDTWGKNSLNATHYSLIWSILNNESDRSQRLAEHLGINVVRLRTMWIVSLEPAGSFKEVTDSIFNYLKGHYEEIVFDHIDDHIVVMCGGYMGGDSEHLTCRKWLEENTAGEQASMVVYCPNLRKMADFGCAYRSVMEYRVAVRKVFPKLRFVTFFKFRQVSVIAEGLKNRMPDAVALPAALEPVSENADLMRTLCVYLLDAQADLLKASKLLFVHRNTVKYRLKKISELLCCELGDDDECFTYYLSCIAWRLINGN